MGARNELQVWAPVLSSFLNFIRNFPTCVVAAAGVDSLSVRDGSLANSYLGTRKLSCVKGVSPGEVGPVHNLFPASPVGVKFGN